MDHEEKQKILKNIYSNISTSGSYAGIKALYQEAKKANNNIKYDDVIYFLDGERTYGLFKPRQLKFPRSKTVPAGYMTDFQADLAG